SDGNEAAGKLLVADASGNATWKANSRYTISGPLNTASGTTVAGQFSKLTDFFKFQKIFPETVIEVRMNCLAGSGSFAPGTTGVRYQVRIDDKTAAISNDGALTASNDVLFVIMYAVFTSMSAV